MPEYNNQNSGALFSAKDKKRKNNDRDYSGNLEIDCPHCGASSEHWISGWKNKARSGITFLSLKFSPKEAPRQTSAAQYDDLDDDIPF